MSIVLLEGSEASPSRPFYKSRVKFQDDRLVRSSAGDRGRTILIF
jgi:hypothetical protein